MVPVKFPISYRVSASSGWRRYLIATGFVFAALLLNSLPPAHNLPFLFFFGAVALTARVCGFGPSVYSTVLSGLVADYFFFHPRMQWAFSPMDIVRLLLFALVCLLIASLALQRSEAQRVADVNQARLAAIVQSSDDAILSKTLEGIITSWNKGAERLYGYTEAEVIGKHVSMLSPPELPADIPMIMSTLQRGEQIQHHETVRMRKDGSRLDISVSVSPIHDAAGNVIGASAIARDVTAQKVAAAELARERANLHDSEQRLQFAQRAANMGSWEWNIKTGNLWWSERISPMHGYKNEALPPSFENWIHAIWPEDRERVQEAVRSAIEKRGDYELEYRTQWPDGTLHWIVARGQVLSDEKGDPEKMIGIGMDVTERKAAEETLRKTEKLAATGRLAASIAHEINNPLEAVTNLLYLLRKNPSLDEKGRRHLSLAEQELERVAHISKQTLGFYRQVASPSRVDVASTLDSVLSVYTHKLEGQNIKVEKRWTLETEIHALAGEIRQVFSNLIANSIDAMPEGGTLILKVSKSHAWGNGNRFGVRVVIADTGTGISPAQQRKLFEPFFTTKRDVGTGLGLWVSKSIVEKHEGSIQVRSSVRSGQSGTVFSIFLPASAPTLVAA
jgi:PAS domain S-box-containing protein